MVDRLLEEGHYVRVFDIKEEYYRKPLSDVDYQLGEFGNRGLFSEVIEGVDIVVHLISTTLPKTSNDDPVFDLQSNVVESLFLLEKCVEHRVKKVIYISSGGTVYGIPGSVPVHEEAQTNPICSYGIGKLTVEKYLELYKRLHNLDFVILRPSNAYGCRQNPNGIQGVISVFLGKVIRTETIQIWGDGEVVRDFIFVEDLVDAIYRAIIMDLNSTVFNIGSGEGHSINQLLSIVKKVTGHDIPVAYSASRSYDVPRIYLDINRAATELKWKPFTSIDQGIEKTWDFIKNLQ
jgi:UDP-glucose 4-epimerase